MLNVASASPATLKEAARGVLLAEFPKIFSAEVRDPAGLITTVPALETTSPKFKS
jgi:hypothetical protein